MYVLDFGRLFKSKRYVSLESKYIPHFEGSQKNLSECIRVSFGPTEIKFQHLFPGGRNPGRFKK